MAQEIERKFLVVGEQWRAGARGVQYRQGYLVASAHCTVRVRITQSQAYLTIKGPTQGISRSEYEYPIPPADAEQMLDELCAHPPVEKTRYRIEHAGRVWEVDEFAGANRGLILAEIELERFDQAFNLPDWVGAEVSHDARYFNASLAQHPYTAWKK